MTSTEAQHTHVINAGDVYQYSETLQKMGIIVLNDKVLDEATRLSDETERIIVAKKTAQLIAYAYLYDGPSFKKSAQEMFIFHQVIFELKALLEKITSLTPEEEFHRCVISACSCAAEAQLYNLRKYLPPMASISISQESITKILEMSLVSLVKAEQALQKIKTDLPVSPFTSAEITENKGPFNVIKFAAFEPLELMSEFMVNTNAQFQSRIQYFQVHCMDLMGVTHVKSVIDNSLVHDKKNFLSLGRRGRYNAQQKLWRSATLDLLYAAEYSYPGYIGTSDFYFDAASCLGRHLLKNIDPKQDELDHDKVDFLNVVKKYVDEKFVDGQSVMATYSTDNEEGAAALLQNDMFLIDKIEQLLELGEWAQRNTKTSMHMVKNINESNPTKTQLEQLVQGFRQSHCANCGKEASKRCGACQAVYYCDSNCSKQHWAQHKALCGKVNVKKYTVVSK
ncbi:hypothetical protein AKO1_012605 [Acrasis kona]|uniref:MYND-type domain-containing protein n=1 Tax=Acrasis kona TaxID=1008807 RepID=A0AAW2YUS5_9EUKA